jgi:hypothetical protein
MKNILTIFFLFLFSHFYSQSITVDLKNEKLVFDTIQFITKSEKVDSIFIDSKYVGNFFYDSDSSGVLANTVMIYLNVICPIELENKYYKINEIIHYGVKNEYLKRLKTDTTFSKNKNTNPFFKHLPIQNSADLWAETEVNIQGLNVVSLTSDDYIRLASINMKKSANLKIISKLLIVGGTIIVVAVPTILVVGAVVSASSIIVDIVADSKLINSSEFLSKSTESE